LVLTEMKDLILTLLRNGVLIPLMLAGFVSLLIIITIKIKSSNVKVFLVSIIAIFIALFLYEGYFPVASLIHSNKEMIPSTFSKIDNENHPILGYSPPLQGEYLQRYTNWKNEITENMCTIKNHLRTTPNSNLRSQKNLLVFGCSFMFGFGIDDNSTLPFFINQQSQNAFKVFNHGMIGYGTHQMLAQIEHLVPKEISVLNTDNLALYWFLPDHIRRAAGYSSWDRYGPRYEINNSLEYKGSFTKFKESKLRRLTQMVLDQSKIYRNLYLKPKFNRKATTYDVQRASAIIAKSNQLLNDLNTQFYVLVWDYPFEVNLALQNPDDLNLFLSELKDAQVNIILFSDILPYEEYEKNKHLYTLNEQDSHPSPYLNELVAKYLAKIINPQEE